MKQISYVTTASFDHELKKLSKKYRSLPEDLELAKRAAIELFHFQNINSHSVFPIQNYCFDAVLVYKLKKFACRSLKGRGNQSGIRIIYAFFPAENKVEFIEIYFKGDKANEDHERIKEYLKSLQM